jgi:hypothetical protein
MRYVLFWDITQRVVVFLTDVSVRDISPLFRVEQIQAGKDFSLDFFTFGGRTDRLSRNVLRNTIYAA